MSFTFISRNGGGAESGTIVLWYGLKADIPAGWTYYAAAAGKLVAAALTPNTTALGDATHTHTYSAATADAGVHGHTISLSIGQPINATLPAHYAGGTPNKNWSDRYHTNHSQAITVSNAVAHNHSLLETGASANLPLSFGLYFIRKT